MTESADPRQLDALRGEGVLGLYLQGQPAQRQAYLQLATADGRMRGLLEELDQSLRTPVVVFKGAAYLGRLYGLGQRHVGDVDLVGGGPTRGELERIGFRVLSEHPLVLTRENVMLDLHEHPLGRQREVTRWCLATALRDSVPLFENAGTLRRFHDRDEAIIALLHGAKHAWSRLAWLVDLARLGIDQARLRELGAQRYGWYGAALLDKLLGIPGEVGPLWLTERWFLRQVARRRAREELGMLLPLHTLGGIMPRLRYLHAVLAPREGSWTGRIRELAARLTHHP